MGEEQGVETLFYSCESSRESMLTGKNHISVKEDFFSEANWTKLRFHFLAKSRRKEEDLRVSNVGLIKQR
jgi:hypothetical protein